MRASQLLDRLGFGREYEDYPLARRLVLAALGVYLLAFVLFYPRIAINTDEASYILQARVLLDGRTTISRIEPRTGEMRDYAVARYPLGTALAMAPFVWLAGDRGAFVVPCLSLVLGVLFTALWLRDERRSPIFALLVLGFPASLVLGRVAMSDAPSLGLVALGLWLFWRGQDRSWHSWFASGCVAGIAFAFREANALPFVGFYAGAVVRGERRAWALAAGVALGLSVRLVSATLAYDDPFFYRSVSATFGRHGVGPALGLQLLGLLVFVPGGLVFALTYRGPRRPELIATVCGMALFYLAFGYGAVETGLVKRLVLGLRFYLPLLPLMAFAAAESAPRLWRQLLTAAPARRAALETLAAVLIATWITGVIAAAGLSQWALHSWTDGQAQIRDVLHAALTPDDVVITNSHATFKFMPGYESRFYLLNRSEVDPTEAGQLARRWGGLRIVFLERDDTAFWRDDQAQNAAFIASVKPEPRLEFEHSFPTTQRLRIWRVGYRGLAP